MHFLKFFRRFYVCWSVVWVTLRSQNVKVSFTNSIYYSVVTGKGSGEMFPPKQSWNNFSIRWFIMKLNAGQTTEISAQWLKMVCSILGTTFYFPSILGGKLQHGHLGLTLFGHSFCCPAHLRGSAKVIAILGCSHTWSNQIWSKSNDQSQNRNNYFSSTASEEKKKTSRPGRQCLQPNGCAGGNAWGPVG